MAKVSPLIRSFNAGEISPLVEGRTDLDRYPSSNRSMLNYVAAPQGPAIPRSGTEFVNTTFAPDVKSILIPFVFSEEQSLQIEFTGGRIRFFEENGGLLIYAPVAATGTGTAPFTFNSPALTALGAAVGDQVALGGYPSSYNLNGEVVNITAKVGDDYTVDKTYPAVSLDTAITVGLVYAVSSPYGEDDLEELRDLQSLDVIYLTHPAIPTHKLRRKDTYDWDFVEVDWTDGPYMDVNETSTKLSINTTGNAIPNMTSNVLPAGSTASATPGAVAGYEAWKAFDNNNHRTSWVSSGTLQGGALIYQTTTPFICDGYSIYIGLLNDNISYTSKDRAPGNFTFEGSNDGVNWTVLDRQNNYVLYDNNKSVFFKLDNTTSFSYYRLNVDTLTRNGDQNLTVGRLVLRSTTSTNITITASAILGINNDQGFKASDVGRLIRIRGNDGFWRPLKITGYTSATVVEAKLLGEPFSALDGVTQWRLGYYSDTTGYPNCAAFFQDRLWLGGCDVSPDLVVGSVSGKYEDLTITDFDGKVLDTHAIVQKLNSRRLSRLRWLSEGDKGLLAGTGSREWLISAVDGAGRTITPGNAKATSSSSRGSSKAEVVTIDNQVVYIQRSGRTIREFAYVYEADGYKSPSMSLLSSHLGIYPFVQMAYAMEPYSIIWMRRANGTVVGLTYNRDENVVGWHRHDFSGGIVESISCIPSTDGLQDVLWLVIRREVDGQQVRYIEKLTRFWDFDMTIEDAHYVDCALRYDGEATDVVFGLQHLEGREDIYGLADGIPIGPLTVTSGTVVVPTPAEKIILGIGFDAEGETSGLENGAQDGTAQGKEKRINRMTVNVWQSYGGEMGTWNEDEQRAVFTPLEYPTRLDELEEIALYSGLVGPIVMQPGYEKRGSVFFKRPKASPLPFSLISVMPQMTTQDGG